MHETLGKERRDGRGREGVKRRREEEKEKEGRDLIDREKSPEETL